MRARFDEGLDFAPTKPFDEGSGDNIDSVLYTEARSLFLLLIESEDPLVVRGSTPLSVAEDSSTMTSHSIAGPLTERLPP